MMRQAISKKTARRKVSGKSGPQATCGVGEVGAAGDLSVVGHQDNVVGGEGFHDRSGEFRATGRKERHHRHFTADVEQSFEGYIEVCRLVLHAGYDRGVRGLEVQDAADFRPFPHCPEVESGLHRGMHSVQGGAVADAAEGDLVLPQFPEPGAGRREEGAVLIVLTLAPQGKITAAARQQSGLGAFVGTFQKILYFLIHFTGFY